MDPNTTCTSRKEKWNQGTTNNNNNRSNQSESESELSSLVSVTVTRQELLLVELYKEQSRKYGYISLIAILLFLCGIGYIVIDKNAIELSSLIIGSSSTRRSIGSIKKSNMNSSSSGTESVLISKVNVETIDVSQKSSFSSTPTTTSPDLHNDVDCKDQDGKVTFVKKGEKMKTCADIKNKNTKLLCQLEVKGEPIGLKAKDVCPTACSVGDCGGGGVFAQQQQRPFVDFPSRQKLIPKEEWKRLDNSNCISTSNNGKVPEWQHRAPYLLIIGSMKAGTSALNTYVTQHSRVVQTKFKESHFYDFGFQSFATEEGILQSEAQKRYRKKYEKEETRLKANEHEIVLDDSPRYIFESDIIPARVNCVSPWVKVIAILRNPIDRAFSQYNMIQTNKNKNNNITFEDWIYNDIQDLKRTGVLAKKRTTSFSKNNTKGNQIMMETEAAWKEYTRLGTHAPIGRGLYVIQLQQWMNTFKGDILVLQSEKMFRDPDQIYKQVLHFLDLPDEQLIIREKMATNKGEYKSRVLNSTTRKMLEELYDPYNQDLYQLLGGNNWVDVWDPV